MSQVFPPSAALLSAIDVSEMVYGKRGAVTKPVAQFAPTHAPVWRPHRHSISRHKCCGHISIDRRVIPDITALFPIRHSPVHVENYQYRNTDTRYVMGLCGLIENKNKQTQYTNIDKYEEIWVSGRQWT